MMPVRALACHLGHLIALAQITIASISYAYTYIHISKNKRGTCELTVWKISKANRMEPVANILLNELILLVRRNDQVGRGAFASLHFKIAKLPRCARTRIALPKCVR